MTCPVLHVVICEFTHMRNKNTQRDADLSSRPWSAPPAANILLPDREEGDPRLRVLSLTGQLQGFLVCQPG